MVMKRFFFPFLSGLLFSLGLGLSGMTQPHIVQGFLDLTGEWNPSLMAVMIGAIFIFSFFFQLISKRKKPLFEASFHLPEKKQIDHSLILGAALFGIGWGWSGICPGPALVDLISGQRDILLFVVSMLIGMRGFSYLRTKTP